MRRPQVRMKAMLFVLGHIKLNIVKKMLALTGIVKASFF
jgi:hypothetical protein